jgi:hypothetical protein
LLGELRAHKFRLPPGQRAASRADAQRHARPPRCNLVCDSARDPWRDSVSDPLPDGLRETVKALPAPA